MIDWNKLQQDGFFSFDICSAAEIEDLKKLYISTQTKENRTGMYVSINSGNSSTVKEVSEKIYQILEPSITALFPEYRYFVGHFAVKSKQTFYNFDLHRDWNVVDETEHSSIGVWIPLSISTSDNGGMCFIPGSHLFNNAPRSGSLGIPFIKIEPDIEPYLSRTHLVPGQAVCFYKNLFHGSFSNPSDEDRVAVLINFVPKNAATEYVHWNESTQNLQVYSMAIEELIDSLPYLEKGATPTTELKREITVSVPFKKQSYIPKEDLFAWGEQNFKKQEIPNKRFVQSTELNKSVFAELQEKGYAVVKSVFDWQELKNNPVITERLNASSTNNTFYYSLLNNDRETNRILSSLISQQFKHSLSPLFPNHRFLAGSFLVKQARDYSELYLHQDWCNTDEKLFTSITAWAPLTDTDETSGGMFFLDSSHKYFENLRSNSYETARFPLTEIGRENMTPITVRQGDILLFNPAVWHGSFPNALSHPREVFTCVILPQNAPFYYFHKQSEETALRYNVPDYMFEYYLSDIVDGKQVEIFSNGTPIRYRVPELYANDLIIKHKQSTLR